MASYRSDDEALIGLARQLTDAYGEARRREDQDFACDSVAEFLSEYRDDAPSEALLAILDLPLTVETYPLVDEAQTLLAGRGPAVVGLLLEAVLGEVYDPDGPAPERAAETLGLMDRRDAAQGLVEVICGRADDDVKGAAVDGLVALGAFVEPALMAQLDDPRGGDWARAALDQIRYEREHPAARSAVGGAALEEYAAGEGDVPDDAAGLFESDDRVDPDGVDDESDTEDDWGESEEEYGDDEESVDDEASPGDEEDADGEPEDEVWSAGGGEDADGDDESQAPVESPRHATGAGPQSSGGPDQQRIEDSYEEFLRRFEQESGEDHSPS